MFQIGARQRKRLVGLQLKPGGRFDRAIDLVAAQSTASQRSTTANASSTTTAGISGIAGDTAVRSTDAQTGLARQFDADKVQRQISAQNQITQAFSQEAPKAVATYANEKLKAAQAKGDQAGVDQWKEGGTARVGLHALVGGLGGGAGGALGAATSQTLVPLLGDEIAKLDIPVELKQALVAAAGAAIGALRLMHQTTLQRTSNAGRQLQI